MPNSKDNMSGRVYDAEHDVTYPITDVTKSYLVTNKTRGPIALTLKNEAGGQTQTLVLRKNEQKDISGSRMTNYVWEVERRGLIKVEIVHG